MVNTCRQGGCNREMGELLKWKWEELIINIAAKNPKPIIVMKV